MVDEAVACFERCLPMFTALGHGLGEASTLLELAIAHARTGRLDEAITKLNACLPILDRLGHDRLQAHALRRLGELLADTGRRREALAALDRCLVLLEDHADHLLLRAQVLERRASLL